MGRLSVGATFPLEAKFGVGKSAGTRNAILISLMSPSSLALSPRSVSIDAAGRGRICNPRAPTGRLGGRQSGEGAATPDPGCSGETDESERKRKPAPPKRCFVGTSFRRSSDDDEPYQDREARCRGGRAKQAPARARRRPRS